MLFRKENNVIINSIITKIMVSTVILFCYPNITTSASTEKTVSTIAGYAVAKESVLRRIPGSAIDNAKAKLRIAYFHTSHGSRIIDGMAGLRQYKSGDSTKWDFTTDGSVVAGKLSIDDHAFSDGDLSTREGIETNGHTQWYNTTVDYIKSHQAVNVIMWSWCNPAGHNHDQYLTDMENLIKKYPKITFVFMTGHPNGDGEVKAGNSSYQCFIKVTDHCRKFERFCMDYWGIETRDMNDRYYPDANDNGSGDGKSFYKDWMNSHIPGKDYFNCNCVHADQPITGNRIAYASWWLWARIAGWDGVLKD